MVATPKTSTRASAPRGYNIRLSLPRTQKSQSSQQCLHYRKMSSVDSEKAFPESNEPIGTPMTAEAALSQPENTLDQVETRASILYNSTTLWKKCVIVFVCSWSTLAACFSSTSLLSASTEISKDLNTTSQVVTFSTAGLMMAMGMSALVWSPIASVSRDRLWAEKGQG